MAVTPIVSIEATPVSAPPVVTLSPPFEVKANVPVEFPTAVLPVEDVFRFNVGAVMAAVPDESVCVSPVSPVEEMAPDVDVRFKAPVVCVSPFDAVNVPALVTVPVPEVEMFPDVVTASPAVAGDSEVPVLFQKPRTPEVGAVVVKTLVPSV